ncbi:MAG TPA: hypothetical protein DCY88_28995 [Cyanobacteria bacterium UBA11372]|nr:hypothetical protein [Cyanobacteria bacterium UBA11372]
MPTLFLRGVAIVFGRVDASREEGATTYQCDRKGSNSINFHQRELPLCSECDTALATLRDTALATLRDRIHHRTPIDTDGRFHIKSLRIGLV